MNKEIRNLPLSCCCFCYYYYCYFNICVSVANFSRITPG